MLFFISLPNVATLDATQLVLQEERRAKEEIIANKQNIERKSKEFIESQQKKMEELNQAKVRKKEFSWKIHYLFLCCIFVRRTLKNR